MSHFIRRKAKEWISFNAHWARKTFTSLGSKWVGSKGEVCAGCVKEEEKENLEGKEEQKGKKEYGTW